MQDITTMTDLRLGVHLQKTSRKIKNVPEMNKKKRRKRQEEDEPEQREEQRQE